MPRRPERLPVTDSYGARLWFELPTGVLTWRYYVAPPEHPHLDGKPGVTIYRECATYFDDTLSFESLVATFSHEQFHVAGAELTTEAESRIYDCECSIDVVSAIQESLACALGPRYVEGLVRSGFLKLPLPPPRSR